MKDNSRKYLRDRRRRNYGPGWDPMTGEDLPERRSGNIRRDRDQVHTDENPLSIYPV